MEAASEQAELTVLADLEELSARAAGLIAELLDRSRRERGVAHLALSGGGTPVRTYELLARRRDSWEGVELWFADERCVPPQDEDSNYRLVAETLLAGDRPRATVTPAGEAADRAAAGSGGDSSPLTVHRMPGELGPELGARRYAEQLARALPSGPPGIPVLDLVLLGIGPDGHIASLFPGSASLRAPETEPCLAIHDSPKPPPERITLSMASLRAARRCLLLASGEGKALALRQALAAPSPLAPASLLAPGRLIVIADRAAASRLADEPPA